MGVRSVIAFGTLALMGCETGLNGAEECRFAGGKDVAAVKAKAAQLATGFDAGAEAVIESGNRRVLLATTVTEFGTPEDTLISSGSGLTAPIHPGLIPGPIVFDPDSARAVSCARSVSGDEVKCVLAHGVRIEGQLPEIFADGFESITARSLKAGDNVNFTEGAFHQDPNFGGNGRLDLSTRADLYTADGVCGSYSRETYWDASCEATAACNEVVDGLIGELGVLANRIAAMESEAE